MGAFVPVESFFSHVYVVDLSPSLCDVARQRFARLGWKNVTVVCQDARKFRLPNGEKGVMKLSQSEIGSYPAAAGVSQGAADLVTMSYSLSMIPGMVLLAGMGYMYPCICSRADKIRLLQCCRFSCCSVEPIWNCWCLRLLW